MRGRMARAVRLVALAVAAGIWFSLPGTALAGTNVWTSVGPPSGNTLCVAVSPDYATDHTVFTGGSFFGPAGIFKSTSGGEDWSPVVTGLPPEAVVHALAVSPAYATDHTLFAATAWGVYASRSGGASWSEADTGFPGYPTGAGLAPFDMRAVAFSPSYATDHTVFAGGTTWGAAGIFRSTSIETSWTAVNAGLPPEAEVHALAISPAYATDHTLFAATAWGVYASTSGGASWSEADTGFPGYPTGAGLAPFNIAAVAISPAYAADHTVFIGGSFWGGPGLFKSASGGASWTDAGSLVGIAGNLPFEARVRSIAFSPNFATDDTVFVGTEAGVFKSTTGGESWSPVNTGLTDPTDFPIYSVAVSPAYATDHTIFAAHDAVYTCSLETTPPETTPTEPVEQYYSDAVTISVSATDNPSGSGVAGIYYTLDGGARQESSTVNVSAAGTHVLKYWSVDAAGNPEEPHTVTFTIVDPPNVNGTPSAVSCPSLASTGKSFTLSGYVSKHTAGTSPVSLQLYRYESGHWVLRKTVSATASDVLTFSKYSDSTSVPYSGKWRVRARHQAGSTYRYSAYTNFTVIATPSSKGTPSTPSTPATVRHGVAFTLSGYVSKHTAGTSPASLQLYRYKSGKYVYYKTVPATASDLLTFSKYSGSTSVPYSGKWRVRARHKVGSTYLYSAYRYFAVN